jgi:hypothetical protein
MPASGAIAAEATGAIEGKVSEASSHTALQGIEVCAITTNFELLGEEESEYEHVFGCAKTGPAGEYKVSELRPESYFVEFFAPGDTLNFVAQLYDDTFELSEASHVAVVAEKITPDIDAELSPGAEIAGKVTDAATGSPVAEAAACALRTNAKGSTEVVSCAVSEASGEYMIRGLPSGAYKLGFAAEGFGVEYYNGKSSEAEAESVPVVAPELTQGIDVALEPGGPPTTPSGSTPSEAAPTSKLPGGLVAPSSSSPDATLSLIGTRVAVARNGDALVKVDCIGTATCRAKLTLETKRMVTVKGRKTLRTVTVGTSAVLSIAAGKTATAKIKLDAAGRRLLSADHGHLEVELALVTPGRKQDNSVVLIEQKTSSRR